MTPSPRAALTSRAAAAAAAVLVAIAGCSAPSTSTTPATPAGSPTVASRQRGLTGSLTVFAAASLTEAFNDVKSKQAATNPTLSLSYNFAGSQLLVTQIIEGAPADVFASADQTNMQKLQARGLVDPAVIFARNKLAIAVAPGNPKHVTGLADLTRQDLKVVLEDPSVPAGTYARQALAKAAVAVHPVSAPLDVKSALLTVTSGEADAVIVYVTDVAASAGKAQAVAIPDSQNVVAGYPMATLKASKNKTAAQAFLQYTVSGPGQQALRARGFLAP